MKTLEEILSKMTYLTKEEVETPRWKLEGLSKLSSTLTEDNVQTYLFYLQLRPDLSEEERETVKEIIKANVELEQRELQTKYKHFETANY